MDFYSIPIGFGLALSANTAAMNYYSHLPEERKQDILNMAHNVLVNDPTTGYGIFIENMLDAAA